MIIRYLDPQGKYMNHLEMGIMSSELLVGFVCGLRAVSPSSLYECPPSLGVVCNDDKTQLSKTQAMFLISDVADTAEEPLDSVIM